MAKKSRRLPGGKVRKPVGGGRSRPRVGTARPPGTTAPEEVAEPAGVEAHQAENVLNGREAAPLDSSAAGRRALRLEPGVASNGTPAGKATAYQSGPVPAVRRRGAVTPRMQAARTGQRAGTSSMDLVAATYTHIRSDLARIGILAALMLAVIVALSFVLR